MFTEWHGEMNWPLDAVWECEVCGGKPLLTGASLSPPHIDLEWGFTHGVCRCTRCHAQYNMRDRDSQRVTKPISRLKPEYRAAAKLGWEALGLPLDEWIDDMWAAMLKRAQETDKP